METPILKSLPDGTYYTTTPTGYSGLSQVERFKGYRDTASNQLVGNYPITEMMHNKIPQFKKK